MKRREKRGMVGTLANNSLDHLVRPKQQRRAVIEEHGYQGRVIFFLFLF